MRICRPGDMKAMLNVLVEAERCAIRTYTEICNMTLGKDHRTFEIALGVLHEEVEHEAWFSEYLGEGPSGHFRRGAPGTSPRAAFHHRRHQRLRRAVGFQKLVDDVPPGHTRLLRIDRKPVVLANFQGHIYAFFGLCRIGTIRSMALPCGTICSTVRFIISNTM